MSRDDLQADLLADLAAKELEPTSAPVAPEPAVLPPDIPDVTPAISVDVTPLRWSRPRFVRSSDGLGKALRVGPVTVQLTAKES
jgi:hypothetical protein